MLKGGLIMALLFRPLTWVARRRIFQIKRPMRRAWTPAWGSGGTCDQRTKVEAWKIQSRIWTISLNDCRSSRLRLLTAKEHLMPWGGCNTSSRRRWTATLQLPLAQCKCLFLPPRWTRSQITPPTAMILRSNIPRLVTLMGMSSHRASIEEIGDSQRFVCRSTGATQKTWPWKTKGAWVGYFQATHWGHEMTRSRGCRWKSDKTACQRISNKTLIWPKQVSLVSPSSRKTSSSGVARSS